MAARHLRARNYFAALIGLLAVLYALVLFTGSSRTPQLGLDLQGGTTVTLTAKTNDGKAPSKTDLELARQIIEQRVNGLGVAEAEVVTEGSSNIVISVPGDNGDKARELGATAQLRFRPVVASSAAGAAAAAASASAADSASATDSAAATSTDDSSAASSSAASSSTDSSTTSSSAPTSSAAPSSASESPAAAGVPDADVPEVTVSPAADTSAAATSSAADSSTADSSSADSSAAGSTDAAQAAYDALACDGTETADTVDSSTDYIAACSTDGTAKYLLGPAVLEGTAISDASAGTLSTTGAWVVNVDFDSAGSATWAEYTTANVNNAVGITLDGKVVSAPTINSAINGGSTQISGNFDQASATELANQLKYGALPLTFTQANAQSVSTELGSEQLEAGLIAGAIGIALVFVYSLVYYRLLGVLLIVSLVVSAGLVYASLVLLGRQIGFTLSLAGIAGFIVSIGITADSFVVYFERLKDEIREGRSLRSATPRAWVRARRTILSADAVSFLAAAILYLLAIGDVKGFAFTLGLSTVLDLIVVFLFTHPFLVVLSRSKGFGSNRMSGLGRVDHRGRRPTAALAAATNGSNR